MQLITLEKHDNTYNILALYTNAWPPPTKVKSSLIWRFVMFFLITFSQYFFGLTIPVLVSNISNLPHLLIGFLHISSHVQFWNHPNQSHFLHFVYHKCYSNLIHDNLILNLIALATWFLCHIYFQKIKIKNYNDIIFSENLRALKRIECAEALPLCCGGWYAIFVRCSTQV